jgi:predicted transcriptional regulator
LLKEAKMETRISNEGICNIIKAEGHVSKDAMPSVLLRTAQDLQDARKELEAAKKDSVWRELPDDVSCATVEYISSNGIVWSVPHKRTLPKTPKQELIDSFAEKNALAMKCSGLNKELLEAFVKEYEEVMKPLDK